MPMNIETIDYGKPFDFGKTSQDYAKYRDIYPQEFYDKILSLECCKHGQTVLDIGTGTGVLPRNMYHYGAKWIATDISENQIEQAKLLVSSSDMDIVFKTLSAENIDYPDNTFDVVTACQCIWYLDHKILAPNLARMLKTNGKFLILYMAWLPFEDEIASRSEEIILKYNPDWTGNGETRKNVLIPDEYKQYFDIIHQEIFDVKVPFTRESWNGRMKACRGVGASMSPETLKNWNKEHLEMLDTYASEKFSVLHFVSIAELTLK